MKEGWAGGWVGSLGFCLWIYSHHREIYVPRGPADLVPVRRHALLPAPNLEQLPVQRHRPVARDALPLEGEVEGGAVAWGLEGMDGSMYVNCGGVCAIGWLYIRYAPSRSVSASTPSQSKSSAQSAFIVKPARRRCCCTRRLLLLLGAMKNPVTTKGASSSSSASTDRRAMADLGSARPCRLS